MDFEPWPDNAEKVKSGLQAVVQISRWRNAG